MNEPELIARQALQIAELEEKVKDFTEMTESIHCALFCIGSPLNDGHIDYTREQLRPFFAIAALIE